MCTACEAGWGGELRAGLVVLEQRVNCARKAAGLAAGARDDVVQQLPPPRPVAPPEVLQVVVMPGQVQLHPVALQQRLHPLCGAMSSANPLLNVGGYRCQVETGEFAHSWTMFHLGGGPTLSVPLHHFCR